MSEKKPKPVGLVKGPGPTPQSFTFISPDPKSVLKAGEFLTYSIMDDGEERPVLARVRDRQPIRPYPNSFMADPNIAPEAVAALLGYSGHRPELFELTAEVVGYYDDDLRSLVNPQIPPRAGSPICLAEDDELSQLLSPRKPDDVGAAEIGWLLSRGKGRVPVVVDVAAIASTHLAIIANTGSGKSYLTGVLMEEMLKAKNRAAVLIIDPHGEYDTLAEMQNLPDMIDEKYRPQVHVYKPGEVKVRIGTLSLADLHYLLRDLSERMEYVLGLAYRRAQKWSRSQHAGEDGRWTLEILRNALRQIGKLEDPENDDEQEGEKGKGKYKETADAVLWRLNVALDHNTLFDDVAQVELRDLMRPGKCTVLQLNEVDKRQQQVIAAVLLRRLYEARVRTKKGQATVTQNSDLYLPYPIFVVFEEAHHFAPSTGDAISSGTIKQTMAEGRKFGVGIALISQRPGKLDSDALSQCNTQFLMRIVNPADQDSVRHSVESVGQDVLDALPGLSKGQAIIAGAAVNTPILCRVRKRYTTHGAQDISAPEEWRKYAVVEEKRLERDAAPVQMLDQGKGRWKKS
jgi:DNA helicase HerA-like ATPase